MKKSLCIVLLVLFVSMITSGFASSDQPITAEFTLSKESATIGHPFTVSYELSGGSGVFNDVKLQVVFKHTSNNDLGYIVGEFSSVSDSCTFIPPSGESMNLMLYGSDSAGKEFHIFKYDIPIQRNPDIPVSISLDHSEIAIGNTLTADYRISGASSFKSIEISWTVLEKHPEHAGVMQASENISPAVTKDPSGSVSYKPNFGEIIYLVIQGQDQDGNRFYAESNSVAIVGNQAAPITAEFTLSKESATIGHPFTVSYELSGGSGVFNDVKLQVVFKHTSNNDLGYIVGEFSSVSDSCTFIPPSGESMNLMLYGSDSAGKEFHIFKYDIPIQRNPDIPVSISLDHSEIAIGNTLTADYRISGASSFKSIEISWTVLEKHPEHAGVMQASENISPAVTKDPSGSVSYKPNFGEIIYLVIQGQDQDGNRFYEESKQVTISQSGEIVTPPDEDTSLPGDADGDDQVDITDALMILRYSAGENVTLNTECADVDGSDKVDATDALLILQHSAGWNVTLK